MRRSDSRPIVHDGEQHLTLECDRKQTFCSETSLRHVAMRGCGGNCPLKLPSCPKQNYFTNLLTSCATSVPSECHKWGYKPEGYVRGVYVRQSWNLAFKSAMCDSVGFIRPCHWTGDSDLGGYVRGGSYGRSLITWLTVFSIVYNHASYNWLTAANSNAEDHVAIHSGSF